MNSALAIRITSGFGLVWLISCVLLIVFNDPKKYDKARNILTPCWFFSLAGTAGFLMISLVLFRKEVRAQGYLAPEIESK